MNSSLLTLLHQFAQLPTGTPIMELLSSVRASC